MPFLPMKICRLIIALLLTSITANAQQKAFTFAHVSDTHIGNETAAEDLRRTVKDINAHPEIRFVIISGDITEFGADEELKLAKTLLDSLNKPWYIVPGNHDMNWSESGGNSFKKVFGSETFAVKKEEFLFLGTNCGPNMRMSPGQIPRENIVWLDSVLKATSKETPIIFVNHYPQDSSLNNWYETINRLKTHNIQLAICGHGHANNKLNFEGIPAVMGRSNLRAKDSIGGYNLVTIKGDSVFYAERTPGVATKPVWTKERLFNHHFSTAKEAYKRPSYAVNQRFNTVKTAWTVQDNADIGSGMAITGNLVITANTGGWIKAYDVATGKQKWATKTGGKIYSTPCAEGDVVVVACSDKYIYALDKNSGKIRWKAETEKPDVASPVIASGSVFCGGSDGHFRSYNLQNGKVNWDFDQVKGFVVTRPLLYKGKVFFGTWGNNFYSLDQQTGVLIWNWDDGYKNRMFSPAACYPVATASRLFLVAPDRSMTSLDASTGKIIWRKKDDKIKVRESMGLSADSSLAYVKTMDGDVLGISTKADTMQVAWQVTQNMGYDISPTNVQEHGGLVFAASNSGVIYAYNRNNGSLAWMHKLSNSLVNPISFLPGRKLVASTMDGKVTCLSY